MAYCQGPIANCTIESNEAGWWGGGLYGCNGAISDCTVAANFIDEAGGYGGGLANCRGTVSDCTIRDNIGCLDASGAGLAYCPGPITGCLITRNDNAFGDASTGGGMAFCGKNGVDGCTINWNSAGQGGGVYSCTGTVRDCVIVANSASGAGGGMKACTGNLSSSTVAFNRALGNTGGGGQSECSGTIDYCIFWANTGGHFGGATPSVRYSCVQGGYEGEGNIDEEPGFTADFHLRPGSPCVDRGDPAYSSTSGDTDIDGDPRVVNGCMDIGPDELLDSDADGLPDFWEQRYPAAGDPAGDPDDDGLTNLEEYQDYGSNPVAVPLYVDSTVGDDSLDGRAPVTGDGHGPKRTIQAGIDAAVDGDTVLVAAGTYSGTGNFDLHFAGKAVVPRSVSGAENTIIDCDNQGRGFLFQDGETARTAVVGFTIRNGRADAGGGVFITDAAPQLRNCVLTANTAMTHGGGLYVATGYPLVADCRIDGNAPDGVWGHQGGVTVEGKVEMVSAAWTGSDLTFTGSGTLTLDTGGMLHVASAVVRCNLSGPGQVKVDSATQLVIEGHAVISLPGDGQDEPGIACDGLFHMRGSSTLSGTMIKVRSLSLEPGVIVTTNNIEATSGAPYGQFFVEQGVIIENNDIYADGDRYLDLRQADFTGNIHNDNRIHVTISEGQGGTRGGLLECRGLDQGTTSEQPLPDNPFFLHAVDPIPGFDTDTTRTWTLESLTLLPDAKVNLTNRFAFGNPASPHDEVLYVKELVLGENSILNTGFQRLYYGTARTAAPDNTVLQGEALAPYIRNVPLLGFSLSVVKFDDLAEFSSRLVTNNYSDSQHPACDRTQVERVVGDSHDPAGLMRMNTVTAHDPSDPTGPEQLYNARVKAPFSKSAEQRILIQFDYVWENIGPGTELVVYLTDVPDLLEPTDPVRASHYVQVARLLPPPPGRYGAVGSLQLATFRQFVSASGMDFAQGTRVELELVGPAGTSILINDFDPQVLCFGTICGDVTGDTAVNAKDFLTMIGLYGQQCMLASDGMDSLLACLDSVFTEDGYVDSNDVMGWDWRLNATDRLNFCSSDDVPLAALPAMAAAAEIPLAATNDPPIAQMPAGCSLAVSGKSNSPGGTSMDGFFQDCMYGLDAGGQSPQAIAAAYPRVNGRLVRDVAGTLYQLNLEAGLVRVSDGHAVVPNGLINIASDPRNGRAATVRIGVSGSAGGYQGRPMLDAAFDAEGNIYVTPVVVQPTGGATPYEATAKLASNPGSTPPYALVRLYDDPPPAGDNRDTGNLHEVELDGDGHLYVTNSYYLNGSNLLWVYDTATGAKVQEPVCLDRLDIVAPIAMCVSRKYPRLYMASSLTAPDAVSSKLYCMSTLTWKIDHTCTINDAGGSQRGMGHITGITEDPATGSLWVTGFVMTNIPGTISTISSPFYAASLATVPQGSAGTYTGHALDTPSLALPLSIVWLGSQHVSGDINGDSAVNIGDLQLLAAAWGSRDGSDNWSSDADCNADGYVNVRDLQILVANWDR